MCMCRRKQCRKSAVSIACGSQSKPYDAEPPDCVLWTHAITRPSSDATANFGSHSGPMAIEPSMPGARERPA